MGKIWRMIQRISYGLAGVSMAVVILLIFVNSMCRYIFKYSLPWCEELTRYMFIAVIFLTLNIMVSQGAALRVDIMDNFLSGNAKFFMDLACSLLSAVALAVFTVSGVQLMMAGAAAISPSMHIPMSIIYALLPLGYFLALIELIRKEVVAIKEFLHRNEKEELS